VATTSTIDMTRHLSWTGLLMADERPISGRGEVERPVTGKQSVAAEERGLP
jgi:hypothetical protein